MVAQGFNWDKWNLSVGGLFTANDFYLFKLVSGKESQEGQAFIGHFSFSSIILGIIFMTYNFWDSKSVFFVIKPYQTRSIQFLKNLSFTALVLYLTAIGTELWFNEGGLHITNVFNPFYYLTRISPLFTQLRVLARFNWPTFWILNILSLVFLSYLLKKYKSKFSRYIAALQVLLLLIDTFSVLFRSPIFHKRDNFFSKENKELKKTKKALDNINFVAYQAILPIPIYTVGSNDLNLTLNPDDDWCTKTYQLSQISQLPLMSVKASRSSNVKTHSLFEYCY